MTTTCTRALVLAAALGASPAAAQTATAPTQPRAETPERAGPESADIEFIRKAADAHVRAKEIATLAVEKAGNAAVRAFAQQLVADHTRATAELMARISLQPPRPAQRKPVESVLDTLNGSAFDRAFLAMMIGDHETAVALFQREARDGRDDAVRAWAEQTLPMLRGHLEKARALRTTVGGSSARA
jgi:putative membrane protein